MESRTSLAFRQILSFGIGGLFIWSGIVKILAPHSFFEEIEAYHVLPYSITVFLTYYLPILEILCGSSLLLKRMEIGATFLLMILTLIFTGIIITAWIRGLDITCGCFGKSVNKSQYAWWIIRDLIFLFSIGFYFTFLRHKHNISLNAIVLKKYD